MMSDRVRRTRIRAGMSQSRFAKELGVHRSAVAQWERSGGSRPSLDKLVLISSIARVSIDWLVTGVHEFRSPVAELNCPADVPEYVARDYLEERLLLAMRCLPAHSRLKLVTYLESTQLAQS
ncbi:helix-turn-helix domain-containing protein [Stenotrophomonas rhizophila]|uniref:Helix-turn-helix domain-containing protein n=2 Tax=Stenotrophomonas rhizophila TaxID=216778 RepID=A0A7V8CF16_9GAMM|nr:helix-turn-helix domain-containing protein [Stenotrophomonas rhizophila]